MKKKLFTDTPEHTIIQLDKKLGDQIILANFCGFSCNRRLFFGRQY